MSYIQKKYDPNTPQSKAGWQGSFFINDMDKDCPFPSIRHKVPLIRNWEVVQNLNRNNVAIITVIKSLTLWDMNIVYEEGLSRVRISISERVFIVLLYSLITFILIYTNINIFFFFSFYHVSKNLYPKDLRVIVRDTTSPPVTLTPTPLNYNYPFPILKKQSRGSN